MDDCGCDACLGGSAGGDPPMNYLLLNLHRHSVSDFYLKFHGNACNGW